MIPKLYRAVRDVADSTDAFLEAVKVLASTKALRWLSRMRRQRAVTNRGRDLEGHLKTLRRCLREATGAPTVQSCEDHENIELKPGPFCPACLHSSGVKDGSKAHAYDQRVSEAMREKTTEGGGRAAEPHGSPKQPSPSLYVCPRCGMGSDGDGTYPTDADRDEYAGAHMPGFKCSLGVTHNEGAGTSARGGADGEPKQASAADGSTTQEDPASQPMSGSAAPSSPRVDREAFEAWAGDTPEGRIATEGLEFYHHPETSGFLMSDTQRAYLCWRYGQARARAAASAPSRDKVKAALCGAVESRETDNLAIVLASYYEKNIYRPKPDPIDQELGWSRWCMEQSDAALDRLIDAVIALRGEAPGA